MAEIELKLTKDYDPKKAVEALSSLINNADLIREQQEQRDNNNT